MKNKTREWKLGTKISTVLNWPVLFDNTSPMHILLEVVEGEMEIEGFKVPKTRAIKWIAPIESDDDIVALLERNPNCDFMPNQIRLRMFRLHKQLNDSLQALEFVMKNTIDVAEDVTRKSQEYQRERDRKKVNQGAQFWKTNQKINL